MDKHKNPLTVENQCLCIGCGFCAATCHQGAIEMVWTTDSRWQPSINKEKCTQCGQCSHSCPFVQENIEEWYEQFLSDGEKSGLTGNMNCYVAKSRLNSKRRKSPSGGVLVEILKTLVSSKTVSAVIAPCPVSAPVDQPHNRVSLLRTLADIEKSRGSFYEPVCYADALRDALKNKENCAIVGTPCVLRALSLAPDRLKSCISFTVGIVCSHNVTGQFMDCLALKEGVRSGRKYIGRLRFKHPMMCTADDYYNAFFLDNGEIICRDRYATDFTTMWRNYYFAQKCCFYCPDFFAVSADISGKDAWGEYEQDTAGYTLITVRSPKARIAFEKCVSTGVIESVEVSPVTLSASQKQTAYSKQVQARERWELFNKRLSPEKIRKSLCLGLLQWNFWLSYSRFFYSLFKKVPVLFKEKPPAKTQSSRNLHHTPKNVPLRVLIAGGFGYHNAGDEAQLNACIQHWKQCLPNVRITILSPAPEDTFREHSVLSWDATRNIWFGSELTNHYNLSDKVFRFWFPWIAVKELSRAHLLNLWLRVFRKNKMLGALQQHFGLPLKGKSRSARLTHLLREADILHFCGGGYLTGMTLSRLWESMLLCRVASVAGTQIVFTGQTIGCFKDWRSRWLARWGLRSARLIYLRDHDRSMRDLHRIDLKESHVQATFDDALFADQHPITTIRATLAQHGIKDNDSFGIVNFHFWGQDRNKSGLAALQMADICDWFTQKYNYKLLFLPMHKSDMTPLKMVEHLMESNAVILNYDYDFRMAKGVFKLASFCVTFKHHPIIFAMSNKVPTIAIAIDDYYYHKNAGALGIFGQDRWVANKYNFFDLDFMKSMFSEFLAHREELSTQIAQKLKQIRPRDGEAIVRICLDFIQEHRISDNATRRHVIDRALSTLSLDNIDIIFPSLVKILSNRQIFDAAKKREIISRALQVFIDLQWISLYGEHGVRNVALFGGGRHTRWLLSHLNNHVFPKVVKILDDNPQNCTLKIPIVRPTSDDALTNVDAVVISSDYSETTLYTRARKLFGDRTKIQTFYRMKWGRFFSVHNAKNEGKMRTCSPIGSQASPTYT